MKKIRTLLMLLCLSMTLSTFVGFAEESSSSADQPQTGTEQGYKENIFTYTFSGNQATITNVDDIREVVTIPETLDGKTVTTLASGAFGGSKIISEVTLPDSVTTIGSMCFAYSTSIARVNLPSGLKTIENGAFYQCEKLWTITIPHGTENIGDSAFALCSNLSAATIPATVNTIGADAFQPSGGFRLYAKPGTVASEYAANTGITFEELITVNVNGTELSFDQPCITDTQHYRTLVPMRAVLEALNAKVSWDSTMDTAGIDIGGYRLLIRPNEPFMMVNGQARYLSSPAIEFNSRILLPIRDVVEAIGGKVGWDENQKLVTVTWKE